MDIFQLFGRIAIDSSGADSAIEETVGKVEGSEGRFSSACKKIGAVVAGAFAIDKIKDFGVACIEAGAAFDSQMSTVSAISGATQEEFEALRAKAQEMGAATAFSATESGEAMEYMAMAGWKTEDMLNGIEGIMNLAAASGEELGTTSDIVTDALTAFGLTAQDSGHFADVLAAASTNANTNVSMMGETFKYVAPVAGALNISVEDTAEAIGLLANSGIKSSQAGTTLRSILTRLSTDAGASSKSLGALGVLTEELGVEFYDSEGKVRNFGTILEEARSQWKTLSEEDSATFAKKIAGEEGISGWLALMNAAPADIEKLNKAIKDCDGSAKEMAEIKLDNLQGDVTLFKSALEGAQIAISDKLTPHLRNFVQGATNLLPKALDAFMKVGKYLVNTFSPAFTSLKDLFKTVASAAEPIIKRFIGISDASEESTESTNSLKGILELLADVIKTTADVVSDFIEWLTSGSSSAEAFKAIVEGLATAFVTYEIAMKGLSKAYDIGKTVVDSYRKAQELLNTTNPLGWAVIGISALVGVSKALESLPSPTEKVREEFAKLSDEEQELYDSVKKLKKSHDEWKESSDKVLDNSKSEFDYYHELADELDTIVDKNGVVKAGYEDRAKVITGELSDALGIEIEMTDGVIENYDELSDKIQDVLLLQEAQAAIDADMDSYMQAKIGLKKGDVENKMLAAQAELQQTQGELTAKKQTLANVDKMSQEEFSRYFDTLETRGEYMLTLQSEIDGLTEKVGKQTESVKETEKAWSDLKTKTSTHEALNSALVRNDVDGIKGALDDMYTGFITCKTGTESALRSQRDNIKYEYEEMKKAVKNGSTSITQADLDEKERHLRKAEIELDRLCVLNGVKSGESAEIFAKALRSKSGKVNDAGLELVKSAVSAINSADFETLGSNSGERFAGGMLSKARSMISEFIDSVGSSGGNVNIADVGSKIRSLTHAATGGIIDKATIIEAGEDGTEAIVPLEKNTGWIEVMANKLAGAMGSQGGGITVVVENVNMKSDDDIEENAYKFEAMRRRAAIALGDT